MRPILEIPYGLILATLLFSGIELFVWYYLFQTGYLHQLIESDRSMVSLFIIAIYTLGALYFLYISFLTSRQFDDLQRQRGLQSACRPLRQFFTRLEQGSLTAEDRSTLLEVLDTRLRSGYAFAFIVADLMLKLGILGTVIGFIIMLGSLSNLNSVDITVMQTLLVEMSGGMKVALFTTLSGLIAGIVLNIKFNLVDWAVDHLINDIRALLVEQNQSA
jgi:biopolymer transport protein ExbB/TolQ